MKQYDFLIVGAGLFGSTFAFLAKKKGYKILVIDKRDHIGGNCYTEKKYGIDIHKYGAHIFHTNYKFVWDFINQFGEFNNYVNQPIAMVNGTTYNMPFNMNMFSKVFKVNTPAEAKEIIKKETSKYKNLKPKNLEEQAIKMVGKKIYEMFIKGYTEKQWGKSCKELPPTIIKRLPVRFTYDNNYFDDQYQGIPKNGYTSLFYKMLKGINVILKTDYKDIKVKAKKIIYTGMIDEFFDYKLGQLEYRSLIFRDVIFNTDNYQGCAVMNYPERTYKYTRSIEHKFFNPKIKINKTIVSYEYSVNYKKGMIPYYPIGDKRNVKLYNKYSKIAKKEYPNIYFSGRLGSYKYYDMDDTILEAITLFAKLSEN